MTVPPHSRLRLIAPALAALALAGTAGCEPTAPPRVLGGAVAQSYLNAARLAVEDELALGPIPGLDTVFLPEASNRSAPALAIAESLAAVPGMVAVIGHANSASSLVASQVYNARRIVQIAPTSTAVTYSEAGPYSFRVVPPDDRQGPFLAGVVQARHPEGARIALFYVNDEYGRGLRRSVMASLDSTSHPVVLELPHAEEAVGDDDVRRGLEALAQAGPDVVLWLGRPQALLLFLPELRRAWPEVPIYGGDAFARAERLPAAAGLWSGIGYTDFLDPADDPRAARFIERFRARFGGEASAGEVLSYDAARVVLQAFREGVETSEQLRTYLHSLGDQRPAFEGLSGPLVFDEAGDVERSFVLRFMEPAR